MPFVPEVLGSLATLKKTDSAGFETLRAQLKKAGCRVTKLDQAIAKENGDTSGRPPSQADILIELAGDANLFHAPDDTGYADVEIIPGCGRLHRPVCRRQIEQSRVKRPLQIRPDRRFP